MSSHGVATPARAPYPSATHTHVAHVTYQGQQLVIYIYMCLFMFTLFTHDMCLGPPDFERQSYEQTYGS